MDMISKQNFVRFGVTTLVAAAIVMPNVSNAQFFGGKRPEGSAIPQQGARLSTSSMGARPAFSCSNIEMMKTKALEMMETRAKNLEGKPRLGGKVETGKAERLAALEAERAKHEDTREKHYEALRARATTDEQKAAVEEFIDTVEGLVAERQAAVDAAIAAFEAGVEDLKGDSNSAVGDMKAKVEADIESIFDEVEASCTDSSTAADIQAAIRAGFEEMRNSRTKPEENSFKTKFEALRTARMNTTKAAIDEFAAGMKEAQEALKAALGAAKTTDSE